MASEKYTLVVVGTKQSSSLATGYSKPEDTIIVWEDCVPTSVEIAHQMKLRHLSDEL
jgi:hypothetical protein